MKINHDDEGLERIPLFQESDRERGHVSCWLETNQEKGSFFFTVEHQLVSVEGLMRVRKS